uniref:Uncharacterized protein n=1 Tax=Romanomermis culicivorax TaxID=13658 RepID=A0A915I5J4_ROMCU
MIATTKNVNPDNAPRKIYPVIGNKALTINLNPTKHTPTATTNLQAATTPALRNPQINSNDIHSQCDWRPGRGAPPQRGSNYSRGAQNYFYEGNSIPRPNDFVQNTYAVYLNQQFLVP